MSINTTLSVAEKHRSDYYAFRSWLRLQNKSLGDWTMESYKKQTGKKTGSNSPLTTL